jgi:hypothetical protein
MKTVLLVLLFLNVSLISFTQGINIGFGTGTEWVRVEAGYSITDNLHAGARFVPGFNSIGIPSYYAVFGRKNFNESDFGGGFFNASVRGYLGASVGLIRLKGQVLYDYYTGNSSNSENRTGIGFSLDAGGEILYGRSGKFGGFFELNLGQVPNYFNTLNSSLSNALSDQPEEEVKLASVWGLATGFRFYFGR